MHQSTISVGDASLISVQELAAVLGDPALRLFDCTVAAPDSADGLWRSARARRAYGHAHIPGAAFADLERELSDPESALQFTLPSPPGLARSAGALGIGDDSVVVLYDAFDSMWAARLWWLLRSHGHARCAVLDGGWRAWVAAGLPVQTGACAYGPATFGARRQPGWFADASAVASAAQDDGAVVCALTAEEFTGRAPTGAARAGMIPGSLNVPWTAVLDEDGRYLPAGALRKVFAEVLARTGPRIVYCGSGIAACSDAFALMLAGERDVQVYDGSLAEWAADPRRPMGWPT